METSRVQYKTDTAFFFLVTASVIGLLDSAYLAYVKIANANIYCTPGLGNCDVVNSSRYSVLWGIPLGIYGTVAFLALLSLAVFGKRIKMLAPYTELLLFAISFAGFLFSVYLTYIELFVLKAICQWCVVSALMMTTVFITSIHKLVVKSAKFSDRGGK
jgi:uncharacterized membrane protein